MSANPPAQTMAAQRPGPARGLIAFTLIEIMVAMTLLTIIILGLVAMFDQTRRAFTTGLSHSDYQEAGRVALDMIGRDLEQLTPTDYTNCANFYVDLPIQFAPVGWPLNAPGDNMTNTLQRLYFVTRYSQQWNVFGYRLDPLGVNSGVGTLYRYSSNNVQLPRISVPLQTSLADFANDALFVTNVPPSPMFSRIIDGVVDFRIRAYDTKGNLVEYNPALTNNAAFFIRPDPRTVAASGMVATNFAYGFYGSAAPAYVEVELALLETRTLERWRALSNNPTAALAYLTNHAGQVHFFRQRIPVRGVDPAAYHAVDTNYP
jgi:hypothetical protein